jgi:hypothetical protein
MHGRTWSEIGDTGSSGILCKCIHLDLVPRTTGSQGIELDGSRPWRAANDVRTDAAGSSIAEAICSLFPVVPAFCNYQPYKRVEVDNRRIREHAGTRERELRARATAARGGCGPE